ncbi:uncharacterized protein N7459_008826 [Penicillium hispanicum]|uniref:uncharacterized protein n=1 Tax=Penicillium hispanicum TaxID=1080232 RepID=UPI0025409C15|nr:uncharacterized protein N7459_008826 [Penicillium hispanicum]KAJ5574399.1 hypothetical protein N7459_008826 [Penicillium hispanicum]
MLLSGVGRVAGLLVLLGSLAAAQSDYGYILERDAIVKAIRDDQFPTSTPSSSTETVGSNGDTWCDAAEDTQCTASTCQGQILPSPFATPGPACLVVGAQMFCPCTPSDQTANFCPDASEIPCDSDCAPKNNVCSRKWAKCSCGQKSSTATPALSTATKLS